GSGWFELEHNAFGIPFNTFTERFEKLEEALQIIIPMLADERPTFSGDHYTVVEAWSGRSSRPGSRRRAPTRCWPGSDVLPRKPGRWCRPIAPRATGSTTTRSSASARATLRRSMPSGCCGSTPCWRTRTMYVRATST
ncbi:MAG: LLM class flavin-dependent oxidoreductase, partial [Actinobacteria bacterium]|nr:LLM class flavin-dependent oxidoreductase [Actinomycetota bacterium]